MKKRLIVLGLFLLASVFGYGESCLDEDFELRRLEYFLGMGLGVIDEISFGEEYKGELGKLRGEIGTYVDRNCEDGMLRDLIFEKKESLKDALMGEKERATKGDWEVSLRLLDQVEPEGLMEKVNLEVFKIVIKGLYDVAKYREEL